MKANLFRGTRACFQQTLISFGVGNLCINVKCQLNNFLIYYNVRDFPRNAPTNLKCLYSVRSEADSK